MSKQLKLSYPAYNPKLTGPERSEPQNIGYEIEQVVGDTRYVPGMFLPRTEVADLCAMSGTWKIIIDKRKP